MRELGDIIHIAGYELYRYLIFYDSITQVISECLIWGICQTAPGVRISLSICRVTLEKSDRTDRLQSLTLGACGRVIRGTNLFLLSGPLLSLTIFMLPGPSILWLFQLPLISL